MRIYGLSGKSGTGKSYNATELCGKMNISTLIDDGLLIHSNSIVGGESAKKQATKIGAVKTALFTDDEHCGSVKQAIKSIAPESILILGTSDGMIEKIAARLELPTPTKIIHIEDITTQDQRDRARQMRDEGGMHVIPAPTMQLKRQFSGYFLDPKRAFKRLSSGHNVAAEKTVVRPTYSYLGNFEISDKVISDIVKHVVDNNEAVSSLLWISSSNSPEGMYIRIILQFHYGVKVRRAALEIQRAVADSVAYMTAFNILGVDVEIRGFKMK